MFVSVRVSPLVASYTGKKRLNKASTGAAQPPRSDGYGGEETIEQGIHGCGPAAAERWRHRVIQRSGIHCSVIQRSEGQLNTLAHPHVACAVTRARPGNAY